MYHHSNNNFSLASSPKAVNQVDLQKLEKHESMKHVRLKNNQINEL